MMIKVCISGFLLLFSLIATAQNQISVSIQTENGKTLAGANAQLGQNPNNRKQSSDQGLVVFENVPNGKSLLKVSLVGYQKLEKTLNIDGNQSLTVQLIPATIEMDEVLVQSTRAKNNSATTFKNLSNEEIRRNNLGQDIPYLLDQTPSVVIGSDAGAGVGYTNMKIRGSDNARINVTLNGITLNDGESMGSFFINLPDFLSSTENMQIQRGVGTSTNGAGSFGASINIQSTTLEENPYAELNNSFGSYNTWKNTLKVGTGLLDNKFAFNARLSRIVSDGYIDRASSDLKSFYVDGGYYSDKHVLKAIVFSGKEKTYQAWYGTPEPRLTNDEAGMREYAAVEGYTNQETENLLNAGRTYNKYLYDNQTDNYTQTHHQLHYSNFINEKINFNVALHYTRGAGYYEEFREDDKLSEYGLANVIFGSDTVKTTDLVRRRWLDNHFYGTTYSVNYNPSENLKFTVGGAYNEYKGDHYGEIIWAEYASTSFLTDKYYLNHAKKTDFNSFIKADYKLNNLLLFADLQFRHINYSVVGDDNKVKGLDFDRTFNFFNPKVGFTYLIDEKSNVYASYAYANKEPVRNDFVDLEGNNPKPEKMQDIEIGYRIRNEKVNIGANLYGMFYKDQLIPTGALNDVGSTLRMNIPNSYRAGFELDAAYAISAKFLWKATAGISQNKIKDFVEDFGGTLIEHGDTDIALSPSTILSNEFSYKPVPVLEFALASKYVSRQYLDNTSSKERSIDAFFVNNLRAIYSFSVLGIKNADLNLSINNLFNEKYETSGYTWGYMDGNDRKSFNFYYPQATTNFLLGLNIRF
ncbi:TonB-dependent receptor [Sphingobacterium hungaricum]|uniref:TonB-dependent receptor n=1 Tax=Sphingobacterium hungaricum TaxID=2082723 RepID=A0A928UXV5_9SPHI|nr:TonB-dependent receptor [Sphingobacterium hungaricum]MBE8713109.1 TonB-dependent receptor [Sphingobacterium hungaricum]